MDSFGIVKCLDVLEHTHSRLLQIIKLLVTRPLVFQRPEKSLHHGVVVTTARAAHRTGDLQRRQDPLEVIARVLTTSVAMKQ